jgi:hypothetical protein
MEKRKIYSCLSLLKKFNSPQTKDLNTKGKNPKTFRRKCKRIFYDPRKRKYLTPKNAQAIKHLTSESH